MANVKNRDGSFFYNKNDTISSLLANPKLTNFTPEYRGFWSDLAPIGKFLQGGYGILEAVVPLVGDVWGEVITHPAVGSFDVLKGTGLNEDAIAH
jgi:hypothetical protein